jgi:hypothetical protein
MKLRSVETDLFQADRQGDGWTEITKLIVAPHDKWVPASTELGVINLRMGKRSPIWRVAANVLNNQ